MPETRLGVAQVTSPAPLRRYWEHVDVLAASSFTSFLHKSQLPSQTALDLFGLATLPPSLQEAWEVAPVNFRL